MLLYGGRYLKYHQSVLKTQTDADAQDIGIYIAQEGGKISPDTIDESGLRVGLIL